MININKFKSSRGKLRLEKILAKRRINQNVNNSIVSKILKDIKKNKNKAVIKYEKKFSNNNRIKPTKSEIKQAIRLLNPKVKKAIDYASNRIFKYHSLQRIKDVNYRDKLNNTFQYKSVSLNIRKVNVYRWDPSKNENPRVDTYEVDMNNCPSKVLDILNKIKQKIYC